jgi:outer membrane protein assembly factor BamB
MAASTSDWPQWRGPERDGISQESGLLKQWPKEGPKLLWQVNDIGDGYSTPSVVGTRIYLMGNRGMENEFVQALSTQDGKPLWTTRVGNVGNPDQDPPYPKARSTPTVDGDFIYALGSDGDPAAYASAIVVQGGGRKQYVQFLEKGIVGVDAKTGELLWRYKEVVKGPAQAFTPVARDGYVYGGAFGFGGGLVRLKPDGGGVAAEQVYFERGLPNGFGGAVLVGDYLYGTGIAKQPMVALEFTTGKVKWKAESFGMSSVAYADRHLYIHNENGDFVLVEATPESYREKGRFTPPNPPKKKQAGQLAEKAFAYPVIANGRLYIRDLETLWAYDIKASR